ncbi:MAG: hypothetical protein ACYDAN_15810 [Candidatus Limnocylindrales bacterium]
MTEPTATAPYVPPDPLAALVHDGTLDAELAALLSLTIEGAIPLVVAGGEAEGRRRVRDALLSLVPVDRGIVRLAGAGEDFAWMPQAGELGWRSNGPVSPGMPGAVMVADLEETDAGTWGEAAHLAIRALTAGYSLIAATGGRRLEDVLERLGAPPVAAGDDELARLGVVLVLADAGAGASSAPQGEAAHYLRPVARDPGGHVQRLPPAVLATRNGASGHFDHFAWGVTAELAARTGRRPIAFEREQVRRAAAISATGD